MGSLNTLGAAKESTIPQAIGIAACDPRFTRYCNEAQERLMNKGRWNNNVARLRVCVEQGCITWPRGVKTIEGLSVCQYGIPLRNQWFEFQTLGYGPSFRCFERCEQSQLLPRNDVCQFRDFLAPSFIRIYPDTSTDDGKVVIVKGQDGNQVPVRTLYNSEWINGEALVLASPFVDSTTAFYPRLLDGAVKPITNGRLSIYSVNQLTAVETLIAIWEPSETCPQYLRTYLLNKPTGCTPTTVPTTNWNRCSPQGDGCSPADTDCVGASVEALVRLQFIPAIVDSDYLLISNLDALKHGMKCVAKEDQQQYDVAAVEMALAVKALREEKNAYSPVERTVITALPQGTARMARVSAGFI